MPRPAITCSQFTNTETSTITVKIYNYQYYYYSCLSPCPRPAHILLKPQVQAVL